MPAWLGAVNNFLSPYRMPLLMALSGLFVGRSLRKPIIEFYVGKVRGLLFPYVLWAVILLAATAQLSQFFDPGSWIPVTYIWFLLFVFLYYCAAPVLARIPAPLIVVAAHLGAYAVADRGFISKFVLFAGYFYLGHFLSQRGEWGRYRLVGLGLVVISVVFNLIGMEPQLITWLVTLTGITGVIGLVWSPTFDQVLGRLRLVRPLLAIGEHSLVFYLSHFPLSVLVSYAVATYAKDLNGVLVWALCLSISLAVGALLVKFRRNFLVGALFSAPRFSRTPKAPAQ